MIDSIFTLDYEVYGNGTGSLRDLVYEPGERLREMFKQCDARLVNYVEVAEFERIKAQGIDPEIAQVEEQIRSYRRDGHEIALHLHPQWYNARYEQGRWLLDYDEYNLCKLPLVRIREIVGRALDYLRRVLGEPNFTPLSFRAGNWLFQPAQTAAKVMAECGIRVDSSVFKGGVQHNHGLDYRRAQKNGYYWPFSGDTNVPDAAGQWMEVPIYSKMVPLWKMRTAKRMAFSGGMGMDGQSLSGRWNRARDLLRFLYPLKLDFCRMTLQEMTSLMDEVLREDQKTPETYRPIVAIGHTKDLRDLESIDAFLAYLRKKRIPIVTFNDIYHKLVPAAGAAPGARLIIQTQ
jgi:hypothetical protein